MSPRRPGLVLFDLDGTLADPEPGITDSVRWALEQLGRRPPDARALRDWIGPPLQRSFRERGGLSPGEVERALALYREHFERRGLRESALYPGIDALLERLGAERVLLAVTTCKPEVYARAVLEHLGISACFDVVCGGDLHGERSGKPEVVARALGSLAPGARSEALVVGDRADDVRAAHAAEIPSIGVTWGYGSLAELEGAGATWIASSVEELARQLLA